eukprot:Seg4208.2 transcript_id=Seg4208.2/GoldUCD/mRNA.D3Y31 product="Complex I intermediate-associated protein 30 mitochondrial" protein_id=Seg4208.2/GoldUCD/D3Y31
MVSRAVKKLFIEATGRLQNGINRSIKGLKGELFTLELDRFLFDMKEEKANEKWLTVSDKEFGGNSVVLFEKSKHGQCVFTGNISTIMPNDGGEAKYTGFCAAKSRPQEGFLNQAEALDLDIFDTIELRLRGDGRSYFFNVHPESHSKDDLYQAFIFTRGGPYWEIIRIPYSKFILTNQGFLQDNQMRFDKIKSFGFSLSDKKNGPFHLEIDYIRAIKRYLSPKEF